MTSVEQDHRFQMIYPAEVQKALNHSITYQFLLNFFNFPFYPSEERLVSSHLIERYYIHTTY